MDYKIYAPHKIERWDEGLALGNGQMGCLIWGSPQGLRFSLDRTDLWDDSVPYGTQDAAFTYRNLVQLARQRDTKKIREIFDAPYQHPTPTKLPAGKIILHFPDYADVESQLHLRQAQAWMRLSKQGARNHPIPGPAMEGEDTMAKTAMETAADIEIKSIVHASLEVGLIMVKFPDGQYQFPGNFSVELQAPAFGKKHGPLSGQKKQPAVPEEISKGGLKDILYDDPVWGWIPLENGHIELFRQNTNTAAFGVVMGVCSRGKKTEVYYQVVKAKDGEDMFETAVSDIQRYMACGYEKLLAQHLEWWEQYWGQSAVVLPDQWMEKNWYISNYLLASCSRKGYAPMPLQGVWTADEDALPPWKGDYHNDLNTQMSYYSYLKANHISQGACFVDFLWDRKPAAAAFAKQFYGTGGICLPAVMTIDGKPLGGWPMYSLSPANQIWLCRAFEDYYRYTADEQFLRERLYPYFKETAECIGGLLLEGEDGYLYLPVSSSPEIHDDEAEAFLLPNSNYDLSLLHYLYQTLERYARQLAGKPGGIYEVPVKQTDGSVPCSSLQANITSAKKDGSIGPGQALGWDAEIEKWSAARRRLPPLAIDGRGVLRLSANESLQESHRHFSHAHAVHPLRLIGYDTPMHRQVIDAVIADLEQLGSSKWVGFSFCWMAELYAIAHKGNEAARMLHIFWDSFCSPNGFHLNGDYKKKGYSSFDYHPFTLEANLCAADALQEMLLYTEGGVVEPFPAVPGEWLQAGTAFERLRGEGGLLISAAVQNGALVSLIIEAPFACTRKIKGWSLKGEYQPQQVCDIMLESGINTVVS